MGKFTAYEKEIKENNILSIQMNLLNACPSRCLSCRKYEWPNVQLDIDAVKCTLRYLKLQGLQTVVFSGGEPLMYKHLPEVIALCQELDIKYSLITTLITKRFDLLELVAKTAYRIHTSIDSVNEERYAYIRGVNGLQTAKESIKFINQNRPSDMIPIRISATMSNLNYKEAIALYEFACKNNCLLNYYNLHTWEDMKMSSEERFDFQRRLSMVVEDEILNGRKITNARDLYMDNWYGMAGESYKQKETKCYLPRISATIDSNGDIYPCCKLLNDNGEYGEQTKYAYGNISECRNYESVEIEFSKRLYMRYGYGTSCSVCQECAQRYSGMIEELAKIIENKKEPMFL